MKGEDQAQQETQQQRQAKGAQPRLVQMPERLRQPQPPRVQQHAGTSHHRLSEEAHAVEPMLPCIQRRLAKLGEKRQRRRRSRDRLRKRGPTAGQQTRQRFVGRGLGPGARDAGFQMQ